MTWRVERFSGHAKDLHQRDPPDPMTRRVWVLTVTGPALVLGSAQPLTDIDEAHAAARGMEVARRRSGGGAVLLEPGGSLWVDVLVPRTDPLWHVDIGVATHWLGDVWASALAALGRAADVHKGGLIRTEWSSRVCFAGLGPGEVTDENGRKLVGISQRRTRAGARFQCVTLAHWDPEDLGELLSVPAGALADLAAVVGAPLDAVEAAFLAALP
ncbi:MAG: lipoyl protein ligase domain-containing protein [Acidimicrobiales bacterium]